MKWKSRTPLFWRSSYLKALFWNVSRWCFSKNRDVIKQTSQCPNTWTQFPHSSEKMLLWLYNTDSKKVEAHIFLWMDIVYTPILTFKNTETESCFHMSLYKSDASNMFLVIMGKTTHWRYWMMPIKKHLNQSGGLATALKEIQEDVTVCVSK